jgi:hypothetical protein
MLKEKVAIRDQGRYLYLMGGMQRVLMQIPRRQGTGKVGSEGIFRFLGLRLNDFPIGIQL